MIGSAGSVNAAINGILGKTYRLVAAFATWKGCMQSIVLACWEDLATTHLMH
jgi:hypothetical protein